MNIRERLRTRLSPNEYSQLRDFVARRDNTEAYIEINDHEKFFGNTVEVVKGRKKELIGTVGEVVWLSRVHYGTNPWFGYTTRIGIRTNNGETVFTSVDNVRLNTN